MAETVTLDRFTLVAYEWDEFEEEFDSLWKPGQHVSLIAPTGEGKSTFAAALLGMRRYVLVIDPKGGDDIVSAMGLRRLPDWPGERKMDRLLEEDERQGRPSRYIIGPAVHRKETWPKLKGAARRTLDGAWDMQGWTLYVDELQVLADREMMNLAGEVRRWLVSARSPGRRTFVSSFQAPRRVPLEAMQQPSWMCLAYTRDATVLDRTAEVAGRPKAEVRGLMRELDEFHWMIVPRRARDPILVVKPPKVA